jgi:nucleoid DNA-binding protein
MSEKYTRADIAKAIAGAGIESRTAAGLALAIVKSMADALIAGKVIELRGLGTLEHRARKGRTMHNPRTMAAVEVPARRVVFFKPSGKLKKAINEGSQYAAQASQE